MISLLKIISLLILCVVFPTLAADYYFKTGFLEKFMLEQSLTIMGTILAIYIASSASFIAVLMAYEESKKTTIFKSTTAELRQNITFVTSILFIHFLLLVATQKTVPEQIKDILTWTSFLKGAKVFTFSLYIYALYELNSVLFGIRERLAQK